MSIKLKELEKKSGNEPLLPHPPLLWDRVTGKGPFVQLVSATGVGAEDAKADKFGRQPFYNGLNDGQKSNQGWFKAWPETMTTERPEEKEKCQDAKADEVIETKNQPISGWAIIVTIVISAIAANLYHWLQPIF